MKFYNLHTHQFSDLPNVLELVNQYPNEFDDMIPNYSIGIHPWHIKGDTILSNLEILKSKLLDKKCLAVGECGLDKRIEIPMDSQQIVFENQLLLAEYYKKPVIIHCVAAFHELISIKKNKKITVPMIVHGFSKNSIIASQLIENGFYLSFGKALIQNPDLETVFQSIPNERIFLETDTTSNEIQEVYALAAKYKKLEINTLKEIIEENFNRVFKK
jgi:TatD DNase family protein